jgi:hypothetical protein
LRLTKVRRFQEPRTADFGKSIELYGGRELPIVFFVFFIGNFLEIFFLKNILKTQSNLN